MLPPGWCQLDLHYEDGYLQSEYTINVRFVDFFKIQFMSVFLAEEFPQLQDKIYLDHAGATLYSGTQIDQVRQELMGQLMGNPHSSADNHEMVEEARSLVLQHFNTDNRQYDVIFTSGATASIKEWLGTTKIK